MKNLRLRFLLPFLSLIFIYTFPLHAQEDEYYNSTFRSYNYQEMFRYSTYGLWQVDASTEQINAISKAKDIYVQKHDELLKSFIYHEDLKVADDQNFAEFEAVVKSVLTKEQFDKVAKMGSEVDEESDNSFDPENWDKAAYIASASDFFLEEYEFLDISPEQAAKLAEIQADMLTSQQLSDYEEKMYNAYVEVFSPTQMEEYEAYKVAEEANEAEYEPEMDAELEDNLETVESEDTISLEENDVSEIDDVEMQKRMEEYGGMYAEQAKAELKLMEVALELLKDYYVPERANIRAKIEMQLSPADRESLHDLRERYSQFLDKSESKKEEGYALPLGAPIDNEIYGAIEKLESEVKHLDDKELLGIKRYGMSYALEAFLQTERNVFYAAKTLATRYDNLLDESAKENDLLLVSWAIQMIPNIPNDERFPVNFEEEARNAFLKEVYQTNEVEYGRNITFLLAKPGEYDAAALQSNRSPHALTVFPIPAKEQQTINFVLSNDGMTTIEIISQDGKLLKTLQTRNMQKGAQQIKVDLQDVPATTFFYRISNAQGTSLVKSIKTN